MFVIKGEYTDLYVKDKRLIKGYRPVEDATLGNPSAKAIRAKDIGMSPSEVWEAILTHGLPNVNITSRRLRP